MQRLGTGTMFVLAFLYSFLFQCGSALSAARLVKSSTELVSAAKVVEENGCDVRSRLIQSAVTGSRFLNECKQWRHAAKKGTSCPKPAACECHCDCPDTHPTGKDLVAPKACPVYPVFPTLAPPTTTAKPTNKVYASTPPPNGLVNKNNIDKKSCKVGEFVMSDGSCQEITMEFVETLVKMSEKKRAYLVKVQKEYNALHQVECAKCPGARVYFETRLRLIEAHKGYRSGLGFLLNALLNMGKLVKDDGGGDGKCMPACMPACTPECVALQCTLNCDPKFCSGQPCSNGCGGGHGAAAGRAGSGSYTGPEFVRGAVERRPHCEPWTVARPALDQKWNGGTVAVPPADMEVCAIVCRNEPSCTGFARDPRSGWCLWFDDADPAKKQKGESKNLCSTVNKTEFVKMGKGHQSKELWSSMAKIHIFDEAIIEALRLADPRASDMWSGFENWWHHDGDGKNEAKLDLKDIFLGKMDKYTPKILDIIAMRKQAATLQDSAYKMAMREAKAYPPREVVPCKKTIIVKKVELKEKAVQLTGFQDPPEQVPKFLRWKDFPNSEDTAWSKIHPDCPMGAPCFCDCKCRGAPPQNFIEPPAAPPLPCPPPPPLPDPNVLTAILNR